VVDLQIAPGAVTALVSRSQLYEVRVTVTVVPKARWKAVCKDCAGAIDSVIELLQGRLSKAVMARMCHEKTGLFPSPAEIRFTCSCPDWAGMCKHVAATLYGIGARLDEKPDLMFTLRQVDAQDLSAQAGTGLPRAKKSRAKQKVLVAENLSEIFGIELSTETHVRSTRRKAKTPVDSPRKRATAKKRRSKAPQ
jgi:uncharacterized Zn finger protein